jgi:phosphoglycerate dehydrogenase-like enzyme
MKLVIYPAVEPLRLARISACAPALEVVNAGDEDEAAAAMADAEALFGRLTPRLLAAAGRLRWVQSPTASLEHYIFPEMVSHPLVLTNMRGLYSDVIADHVFGYILCFARNLHLYLRNQLAARWAPCGGEEARSTFLAGPGTVSEMDRAHLHLADCVLGIVGLGSIGGEVARRGKAFGMRVLAVDPLVSSHEAADEVWKPEHLHKLLAGSDFTVIAAPHTPATEALFGREQFRQMKPTARLINIGRGAIVDLAALVEALREGRIAGAGLDVFEVEPLPADHPLWQMESVIITPHVAGCSPRIAERHLEVVLDNVRRFVRGEPLRNVVDKRQWF